MTLLILFQCCIHVDQLTCGGRRALWLWAGGPWSRTSGYQRGSGRTLSDCGSCGGGWSWGNSYQFQRGETTHASPWQLFGWPPGPYLCSIQYVILGVLFTDLAGTRDGYGNGRSWLTMSNDGCKAGPCYSTPFSGLTSGWTDKNANDGCQWRTLYCRMLALRTMECRPAWKYNKLLRPLL